MVRLMQKPLLMRFFQTQTYQILQQQTETKNYFVAASGMMEKKNIILGIDVDFDYFI